MLHVLAAAHVCRIMGRDLAPVPAGELNDMVAAFPPPGEAARLHGIPLGNVPLLGPEVGIDDLARELGAFIREGKIPFPIFYMPVSYRDAWVEEPDAKEFMAWLHAHGLDVQLTLGGPTTWLRGHWCNLCDIRLRFAKAVTEADLIAAIKLMQLEGPATPPPNP